jgi:hypothetical protein
MAQREWLEKEDWTIPVCPKVWVRVSSSRKVAASLARGALMCSNEDSPPTGVRFRSIMGATTPTADMDEISGRRQSGRVVSRWCVDVGMRLLRWHPRPRRGRP